MLVKQLAGSRAGEVIDVPQPLANRLIEEGRVEDVRDKSQFGDPDTTNIDHRDFERLQAEQDHRASPQPIPRKTKRK